MRLGDNPNQLIEPYFINCFLYDGKNGIKISEDVNFDLTKDPSLRLNVPSMKTEVKDAIKMATIDFSQLSYKKVFLY